tara:strand:+ start:4664 stop:5236 length:573 start_codon:yes stop_codon:yes gene_type:complete
MSDTESIDSLNEVIIDEKTSVSMEIVDTEPITSNIQSGKVKKPRTEKQILALEKARATRKLNAEKNKQMKYDNAQLIEDNKEYLKKLATENIPKKVHYEPYKNKKKKTKIIYASDSEPSDEEVVIVKRKRKPAPKKKKKIIYESPSSSEAESSDEETTSDLQKFSNNIAQQGYHYVSSKPLKYSDMINFG